MNTKEKQLYLETQCDKIMGSEVVKLETEIHRSSASLINIKLRQSNGDEFVVRSTPNETLTVIQTLWGE